MADIGEFAQQAADRFLDYQTCAQDRFRLGLSREAVERFIKAAFYASLIPDESRYPTVTLMSYRKGADRSFHFLFDTPLLPTQHEIAKLAHAVAPDSHICCICDKGEILLGGIHVTMLNEMRESGYVTPHGANPLKVIIREPGHIEMSATGIPLSYKAGVIDEVNLFEDSCVIRALAAAIAEDLQELTTGVVESPQYIFNDLAAAILRLGHGGMLLVAREPKASQFLSLRRIDCLFLQQLLVQSWDNTAVLLESAGGAGNLMQQAEAGIVNPLALPVATDTAMLENCVNSIAHLAGLDTVDPIV